MLLMIVAAAGLQLGLATAEPVREPRPTHTVVGAGMKVAPCEPGGAPPDLAARKPVGVRSAETWVNGLIHEAWRRSPTFARLAGAIEASRTIVYVESRDRIAAGLVGAVPTPIDHASDGTRYVRVLFVRSRRPDDMIQTIGHELQHVVELLDADARGVPFGISSKVTRQREAMTGLWIIETDAARRVTDVIHRELVRDVCRSQ